MKRDYDAAAYFLCRAEEEIYAPAEWWGMIAHVEQMRSGATTDELTYCDHVTSGRGQLFCEQIDLSSHNRDAEKRTTVVKSAIPAAAQAKLDALLAAAQKYADEEGGNQAEGSRGGDGLPGLRPRRGRELPEFEGVAPALYVDFTAAGKLQSPTARELAIAAVNSARAVSTDEDGVTYPGLFTSSADKDEAGTRKCLYSEGV